MVSVPASELVLRIERLQRGMAAQGLDAVAVVQSADLFWLTGTVQQGMLWIPERETPLFLVRKDLERARRESPLERIEPMRSPRDVPASLARAGLPGARCVGMELDVLPVALFRKWESALSDATIHDASPLIRALRSVKSPWEIARMRTAGRVAEQVFARVSELLRPGLPQIALAAELERTARLLGHQGVVRMRGFNAELFYGHVFSGEEGAVPCGFDTPLGGRGLSPAVGQGASCRGIVAGEPVLVDQITAIDGYCVDQTRTFCIGGLPDTLAHACADTVAILEQVIAIARPGIPWGRVWDESAALAARLGHADRFMGPPGAQVSFVGHGVGIEVDEPPFLARGFDEPVLEAGMCIALEPKFVFPGLGSVGVEDTFVVTENGLEALTRGTRDLVVVPG